MERPPNYALAVWFDTYVRPTLGGEKSLERVGEQLFNRYYDDLFLQLSTTEGEFNLLGQRIEAGVMHKIVDAVLKHGRPVANRYYDREVTEQEQENLKLANGLKEDTGDALGVG